jgi:hypothetical protein
MNRVLLALAFLFTVIVPFLFFYFFFNPTERPFGFDEVGAIRRLAISGLFLILGILFSQIYKALSIKPKLSTRKILNYVFSRELIKALLASPVLFLANYLITNQLTDIITANLLAFQTGFFCDSVLSRRREGAGQ